jgi:hypothetical protein
MSQFTASILRLFGRLLLIAGAVAIGMLMMHWLFMLL